MVAGGSSVDCACMTGDFGRSVLMAGVGGLVCTASTTGGVGASSMSNGPLVERLWMVTLFLSSLDTCLECGLVRTGRVPDWSMIAGYR